MADKLYQTLQMIKDITDEDQSALTTEMEALGRAANNALNFINNLKVPEDGN